MVALAQIGTAEPSLLATAQAMIALGALRSGDRAYLAAYLAPEADLIGWAHDPLTWPCDYAVATDRAGRYWCWVYGTTNVSQWATNVLGAAAVRRSALGPVVHTGFDAQAQAFITGIASLVRDRDPPSYLGLCGHSLGGAVAQLLAWYARDAWPAARVEVLTFGQPQAATSGRVTGLPAAYWRVVSPLDPVPSLPRTWLTWVFEFLADPSGWYGLNVPYTHYGDEQVVDAAGYLNDPHPDPVPLPSGVRTDPAGEHTLANYWGRMRQVAVRTAAPPQVIAAFDYAGPAAGAPWPDGGDPLPWPLVRAADGSVYLAPGSVPSLGSFVGSNAMAGPAQLLLNGDAYAATYFFSWGSVGWSETYYVFVFTVAGDQQAVADKWINDVALARRNILANVVAMNLVRVDKMTIAKGSEVYGKDVYSNLGDGLVAGQVNVKQAVSFRGIGLAQSAQGVRELRGFTKGWLSDLGSQPTTTYPFTALANTGIEAFRAIMVNPVVNQNTVQWALPALKTFQETSTFPQVKVKSFTVDDAGYLVLHMVKNSLVVSSNDKILLRHPRQKCVSKLSGRWTVIDYTSDVDEDRITLNKKYCCHPATLAGAIGTAQRYATGWVWQAFFIPQRQTTRKTGRPFGLLAGLQKNQCC